MNKTKIEWCDYTWNPITGCSPASEGCANCYAQALRKRFNGGDNSIQFHAGRIEQPLHLLRETDGPLKIFVCSMGDLFHPDVKAEWIDRILEIIAAVPDHIFITLTKRPELIQEKMYGVTMENPLRELGGGDYFPNLWLGATCENQARADERIPVLLQAVAAVRFVSVEPMLGPVDLNYYLNGCPEKTADRAYVTHEMALDAGDENLEGSLYQDDQWEQTAPPLSWCICGPETGPNKRTFNEDWARSLRDQCKAAGVPFFYKGGLLDGVKHEEWPA